MPPPLARADLDRRADAKLARVGRRQRQVDRDAPQIGDTEQFGIGRDRLAEDDAARRHLPADRRDDADAVERTAADTRRAELLLREAQRDIRLGHRGARRDQVAFGRYLEPEQPFLARQRRPRERGARTGRLDFGAQPSRLAALDHREYLAAPDAFAEIAVQRDDAPADRGGDDLRCLRVAVDRRGQGQPPRAARDRTDDFDPRRRDLLRRQMDRAFFLGVPGLRLGRLIARLPAATGEDEYERHGRPDDDLRCHGLSPAPGRRAVSRSRRALLS